jgi:simple sugar transport system permease protein
MAARAEARPIWRGFKPREVGILGILLGCFAFFLALPPISSRAPLWPSLVGLLAIAAGIWSVTSGVKRIGWFAISAGILGAVFGVLATNTASSKLDSAVSWTPLIAQMLVFATPLTFAALGGMFSERSGVVNIGLEGMMLMGAFFGFWGADRLNSWPLGLLVAMAAGAALALVHGFFCIHLRADQIVGGTAINFLALGLTGYLFIQTYGNQGTPADVSEIPDVHLPGLQHTYFIGPAIGQLNLMIWISFAVLILSYIVMFRTPIGLRIRAVGEHPRAADTVGISVFKVRYAAVIVSGMLAALGGAYLTIGYVHSFNQNMTEGRGFIALAALIFGKWRPFGAFGAALLFGFSSAIADRLALAWGTSWQTLFQALPYLLTLIAVAGVIGRSIPPAAVGRPYKKQ